ncbi:MAG: hypothetical protein ABI612_25295 [Betaproteobacteria bacterium]
MNMRTFVALCVVTPILLFLDSSASATDWLLTDLGEDYIPHEINDAGEVIGGTPFGAIFYPDLVADPAARYFAGEGVEFSAFNAPSFSLLSRTAAFTAHASIFPVSRKHARSSAEAAPVNTPLLLARQSVCSCHRRSLPLAQGRRNKLGAFFHPIGLARSSPTTLQGVLCSFIDIGTKG